MNPYSKLLGISKIYAQSMHTSFSKELENFENVYKEAYLEYPIEDQRKIALDALESSGIYFFLSSVYNGNIDKLSFSEFLNLIQEFNTSYKYQYTDRVLLLSLASNIEGLEKDLYLGFINYIKLRKTRFNSNENSI